MSGFGRRRVLLVEDDEDLVVCLQAVLEEEGYSVLAAPDGEAALEACRFAPTMAFVDLNIGGAPTGAELIAELRRRLPPGARLCLLSGERDLPRHARELGAEPLGTFVASAVAGVDPRVMGIGPVPAVRKLLERAGVRDDRQAALGHDGVDVRPGVEHAVNRLPGERRRQ